MNYIKCFDIASITIDEASERFSPLWEINDANLDVFKQYCEVLDWIVAKFDGGEFSVEVDEETMEIEITLECSDIVIEDSSNAFYELLKRTERFGFSSPKYDRLAVTLVFPSLWEHI